MTSAQILRLLSISGNVASIFIGGWMMWFGWMLLREQRLAKKQSTQNGELHQTNTTSVPHAVHQATIITEPVQEVPKHAKIRLPGGKVLQRQEENGKAVYIGDDGDIYDVEFEQ